MQVIGAKVKFEPNPMGIYQLISKQETRGHFISLLYKCFLSNKVVLKNKNLSIKDSGYLKWHKTCPPGFLKCQNMYKKYI